MFSGCVLLRPTLPPCTRWRCPPLHIAAIAVESQINLIIARWDLVGGLGLDFTAFFCRQVICEDI